MTRKLHVHIGPHKTGTTYIQQQFTRHRAALQKVGVAYPNEGISAKYGHHVIAKHLLSSPPSAPLRKALSEADPTCQVMLSSENFSRLREDGAASLRQQTEGWQVDFFFVLRNPVDLLFSNWQQQVKRGARVSWADFHTPHTSAPESSDLLNPDRVLSAFAGAFGDESIRLLSYDGILAAKTNIASELLRHATGIDFNFDFDSANLSLSMSMIDLLRCMNVRYFESRGRSPEPLKLFRAFYRTERKNRALFTEVLMAADKQAGPLPEFDVQRLEDLQRQATARYAQGVRGPAHVWAHQGKSRRLPATDWINASGVHLEVDTIFQKVCDAMGR